MTSKTATANTYRRARAHETAYAMELVITSKPDWRNHSAHIHKATVIVEGRTIADVQANALADYDKYMAESDVIHVFVDQRILTISRPIYD